MHPCTTWVKKLLIQRVRVFVSSTLDELAPRRAAARDINNGVQDSCTLLLIRPPGSMKDPETKQIKLRSAIRLSLDEFQSKHHSRAAIDVLNMTCA